MILQGGRESGACRSRRANIEAVRSRTAYWCRVVVGWNSARARCSKSWNVRKYASITERNGRYVPERLSETATPISSYMFCPKSNYLSFSPSMMLQQYKVCSRHVSGFTCNHRVVAYNYRFSGLLIQCFVICIDSHKNVCEHVIVLYWALSVITSWAIDPKWNYCLAHYMSYFEELFHDWRNRNRIGCFAGSHTHSITSDLHTHNTHTLSHYIFVFSHVCLIVLSS